MIIPDINLLVYYANPAIVVTSGDLYLDIDRKGGGMCRPRGGLSPAANTPVRLQTVFMKRLY